VSANKKRHESLRAGVHEGLCLPDRLSGVLFANISRHPGCPPITRVSHIGLYGADAGKSEAFYARDLGTTKGGDPENAAGTRYYFSPTQFVEILPLPAGVSKNRLDHVAFSTTGVETLRVYLASRKVSVPVKVNHGSDGSLWFSVIDPEGNRVEFVQAPVSPTSVTTNALSSHIIHVGFIVHDRSRENAFYREILGFRP
jgi:catechol 2,3-dioxygenase-like lactoylglutathione lyase family enzyme